MKHVETIRKFLWGTILNTLFFFVHNFLHRFHNLNLTKPNFLLALFFDLLENLFEILTLNICSFVHIDCSLSQEFYPFIIMIDWI